MRGGEQGIEVALEGPAGAMRWDDSILVVIHSLTFSWERSDVRLLSSDHDGIAISVKITMNAQRMCGPKSPSMLPLKRPRVTVVPEHPGVT